MKEEKKVKMTVKAASIVPEELLNKNLEINDKTRGAQKSTRLVKIKLQKMLDRINPKEDKDKYKELDLEEYDGPIR